jgi:hypothetical protein
MWVLILEKIFMEKSSLYTVDAFWDTEAAVWVATSDEVLGLATEAPTIEQLMQKLRFIIPELIQFNQLLPEDYQGSIAALAFTKFLESSAGEAAKILTPIILKKIYNQIEKRPLVLEVPIRSN